MAPGALTDAGNIIGRSDPTPRRDPITIRPGLTACAHVALCID